MEMPVMQPTSFWCRQLRTASILESNLLENQNLLQSLTFVAPCIVIYFYSKANQMYNISNLFYFGTTLYMYRKVSPSNIRSLRLYIQHQVYVIQVLWLFASKQLQYLYGMMLYVQSYTPDDGRTDRPKHVECCSKIK